MAAFATHIIFGQDVLAELDDSLLYSMIHRHQGVFAVGCQGPDLFLYNGAMLLSRYQKNLGSRMHNEGTNRYFAYLLQAVLESETPEAFEIGISYFCGALAHYTLDTAIHPYVNARIGLDPEAEYSKKKKMPLHHRLESAIDAKMIAVKKNILPSAYVPSKETALTGEERSALADLLSKAVSKAYYVRLREENVTASLWMMRVLADSFYYHPESRKKHFEKVEWIFTEDYFYSNLLIADSYIRKKKIMNTENMPWHNPSDPSVQSTFSVWEIYDHAVQQYAVYLSALKPLRKRYRSRWLMLRQPYYFVQEKRERTKKGAHLQQIRRLEHEKISLEKMQKEIAGAVKQLGNLSYNTGLPLS